MSNYGINLNRIIGFDLNSEIGGPLILRPLPYRACASFPEIPKGLDIDALPNSRTFANFIYKQERDSNKPLPYYIDLKTQKHDKEQGQLLFSRDIDTSLPDPLLYDTPNLMISINIGANDLRNPQSSSPPSPEEQNAETPTETVLRKNKNHLNQQLNSKFRLILGGKINTNELLIKNNLVHPQLKDIWYHDIVTMQWNSLQTIPISDLKLIKEKNYEGLSFDKEGRLIPKSALVYRAYTLLKYATPTDVHQTGPAPFLTKTIEPIEPEYKEYGDVISTTQIDPLFTTWCELIEVQDLNKRNILNDKGKERYNATDIPSLLGETELKSYQTELLRSISYYFVEINYKDKNDKNEIVPSIILGEYRPIIFGNKYEMCSVFYNETKRFLNPKDALGKLTLSLYQINEPANSPAISVDNIYVNTPSRTQAEVIYGSRTEYKDVNINSNIPIDSPYKMELAYQFVTNGDSKTNPVIASETLTGSIRLKYHNDVGTGKTGVEVATGHFGMFYQNVPVNIGNLVVAQRSENNPFIPCEPGFTKCPVYAIAPPNIAGVADFVDGTDTIALIKGAINYANNIYENRFRLRFELIEPVKIINDLADYTQQVANPWKQLAAHQSQIPGQAAVMDYQDKTLQQLNDSIKVVFFNMKFQGEYNDILPHGWANPIQCVSANNVPGCPGTPSAVGYALSSQGYIAMILYAQTKKPDLGLRIRNILLANNIITFAHEAGHVFGATHSVEMGPHSYFKPLMAAPFRAEQLVGGYIDPINYKAIASGIASRNFNTENSVPAYKL